MSTTEKSSVLGLQGLKIDGNWYAPRDYLKSHKDVVDARITCDSNSSGDWDGFFVVKEGEQYAVYSFDQCNLMFGDTGYSLSTADSPTIITDDLDMDVIEACYCDAVYA
jgi:hypothetical protein